MKSRIEADDVVRVEHMLEASYEAYSFLEGQSEVSLESNRQLALSLVKELEIIGEAASKVSDSFQQKHKNIPWRNIIAMRN